MVDIPIEKQFAGQARLVRLLLWKIGDSTDVDACLGAAFEQGMISEDDRAFLDTCMLMEESMRQSATSDMKDASNASDATTFVIDAETVARLRRCADKLNRADSA